MAHIQQKKQSVETVPKETQKDVGFARDDSIQSLIFKYVQRMEGPSLKNKVLGW